MKALRAGEVVVLLVVPYQGGKRRWMRVRPMTEGERSRGYVEATAPGVAARLVAIAGGVVCEGVGVDKDGRTFHDGDKDFYDNVVVVLGVVVLDDEGAR
jgi:hypothetical protein